MFRHLEEPVALTEGWVSSSVSSKKHKKGKKSSKDKKQKEPMGFYQRKPEKKDVLWIG